MERLQDAATKEKQSMPSRFLKKWTQTRPEETKRSANKPDKDQQKPEDDPWDLFGIRPLQDPEPKPEDHPCDLFGTGVLQDPVEIRPSGTYSPVMDDYYRVVPRPKRTLARGSSIIAADGRWDYWDGAWTNVHTQQQEDETNAFNLFG